MKISRRALFVVLVLLVFSGFAFAAQPTSFHLTVELRDGSRVIGTSKDGRLEFKSETLGEMKLPLEKIRSVETTAKTNLVKLTTAGGDTLLAAFITEEIRMETSYGDVRLPVGLVKNVRVAVVGGAGRPRDGLVALWSAENNADDSVGGNHGSLINTSFADGVVGRAFFFAPDNFRYGTYCGVQIPDRPAFALTKSLTAECWIRPRGNGYIIFTRGDHRPGLDPYTLSMDGHQNLAVTICGEDNEHSASVHTPIGLGAWMHVAGVLDDDGGTLSLYTNGVLAAQTTTSVRPLGPLLAEMSPGVGIGNVNDGGNNFPFIGEIDEVGLYDRALSVAEINAIYTEHAATAPERAELFQPRKGMGMPVNGTRFSRPGFSD